MMTLVCVSYLYLPLFNAILSYIISMTFPLYRISECDCTCWALRNVPTFLNEKSAGLRIYVNLMTTWESNCRYNIISFEISMSLGYKAKLGIWTTFCCIWDKFPHRMWRLACDWDGRLKECQQHSDEEVWHLKDREKDESVTLTRLLGRYIVRVRCRWK